MDSHEFDFNAYRQSLLNDSTRTLMQSAIGSIVVERILTNNGNRMSLVFVSGYSLMFTDKKIVCYELQDGKWKIADVFHEIFGRLDVTDMQTHMREAYERVANSLTEVVDETINR